MVGKGLSSDVMYTIMLNGYCRVNCLPEAFALFDVMKKRGIRPDIITYTVMFYGHSKINLKEVQSQAHNEGFNENNLTASTFCLEAKKMELKPDVICYTALIDSY
ncbi:pentatricopeptide repeat-containing protein mitochondrial [Dorcoceras hygrometricum]|uniref:Pentatricopeptide repeat-containing protein mitochondrial n=1 Tax=Dorcoceras hygrometricum TaxID=472368 RepID=A0A2Z7BBH2_9LAMI|nr:pentatricopeptide repeat-containing protein mitochondrial [Dorcoceras hygrometricum]